MTPLYFASSLASSEKFGMSEMEETTLRDTSAIHVGALNFPLAAFTCQLTAATFRAFSMVPVFTPFRGPFAAVSKPLFSNKKHIVLMHSVFFKFYKIICAAFQILRI